MFSIIDLVTVLLTTQHYFAVRHDIDEDTYELADHWVITFSLSMLILGAGVIFYLFTVPLNRLSMMVFE